MVHDKHTQRHVLKSVGCVETPCCNATTANGLQQTMIYLSICLSIYLSIYIYIYGHKCLICIWCFLGQLSQMIQTWVCLKIAYPYTQWLMIIIPAKWLFHWGYTPFSDIPTLIPMWWLKCWDPNVLCRGTGTPISRSRIRRLGNLTARVCHEHGTY